jgi:hypothetical protein
MTFLYTWNSTFEGQPDDTENVSLGASRIRGLKSAISERMAIDHSWAGDDSDGLHKQVTMPELSTKPTVASNQGSVYVKASGSTTALYFEDDAGVEHPLIPADLLYPVGSIYINASNSTNPGTLLGFGTWVAFGSGRVLVSHDSGQTEFNTAEKTGGAKTHTLTINEMPSHSHGISDETLSQSWTSGADNRYRAAQANTLQSMPTGGGAAHNNLQPYIVVYMWKRTA